jgi:hypothetical protein
MTTWGRAQGDVNDTIEVELLGGVDDLVTATGVEGHVTFNGGSLTVLSGTLDVPNRKATLNLGGVAGWLATAARGCWALRTVALFPAGGRKTWPEPPATDEIIVG